MKPPNSLRHATGANSAPVDEALEAFFRSCQAELLGMLYFQTGTLEDARLALQECFANCWRNRDAVPDAKALRAWVFGKALEAGRRLRRAVTSRPVDPLLAEDDGQPGCGTPGGESAEGGPRLARIRQCLRALEPELQEVFLLRENGQLSYDEIAQVLGIPLETVRSRMRTALESLGRALAENP